MSKRVLLDESVPRHLAAAIEAAGFAVTPYPNGWKQIRNGELLARAEEREFDVLVVSRHSALLHNHPDAVTR